MDCRMRVYFGAHTDISPKDQHLQAPQSNKLFFISPPPSPPHGWEMRNEEPPNKEVHAEDLAHALANLYARNFKSSSAPTAHERTPSATSVDRSGSNSTTLVYHPEHHGSHPGLPAISVEDTTSNASESPGDSSPMEGVMMKASIQHTSRPPVELMEE